MPTTNTHFQYPDIERIPGRVAGRRFYAHSPRDVVHTHFRGGLTGLPQTAQSSYPQQFLCPRGVPHPQGGRSVVYLLHLQWVHGGGYGWHGGRNSW